MFAEKLRKCTSKKTNAKNVKILYNICYVINNIKTTGAEKIIQKFNA